MTVDNEETRSRTRLGLTQGLSAGRCLGPTGRPDKRETRGCVAHGPMLTQQSGPFTVEASIISAAQRSISVHNDIIFRVSSTVTERVHPVN